MIKKINPLVRNLLLLTFETAFAENKTYPFLSSGFDQTNYLHCEKIIHQCPKDHMSLMQSCVAELAKKTDACNQLTS